MDYVNDSLFTNWLDETGVEITRSLEDPIRRYNEALKRFEEMIEKLRQAGENAKFD